MRHLIYINDKHTYLQFHLTLFIDDTTILSASCQSKILVARLQSYLNIFLKFVKDWKFKINSDKTETIFIAKKHTYSANKNSCRLMDEDFHIL